MDEGKRRLLASLDEEIHDGRVLMAMARVDREAFVPLEVRHLTYEDVPLAIGAGQTISQPFIVALMTQELGMEGREKVLEVGTGSGYQAAVLAELARMVVSVERVPELAERAREVLAGLGYGNVEVHEALEDQLGWPEGAPYDAIIVTAGAPRIPRSLVDQLAEGGRMIIPVGSPLEQKLLLARKKGRRLEIRHSSACRFVPLIGPEAWPEEPS